MFGLHLWLDQPVYINAFAASIYYVDFSSGSNSNAGTQASPWKSVSGMSTSASCGGATHSVTLNPGDSVVFKGGVTWPAACFPVVPPSAGNASASIYWGVCNATDSASPCFGGTGWPSSGWTRPVFDAAQTVIGHFFTMGSAFYSIIDNIEMKNQNLALGFGQSAAIDATSGGTIVVTNTIVENVYIHDFMSTATFSNANGMTWYSAGGIRGYVRLLNSIIDDSGGFAFNASSQKVTGGNIGGACENCQEVSGTKFNADVAACFGVSNCHDSEFTGINQGIIYGSLPTFYGMNSTVGNHTQAIEAENAEFGFQVYRNWVHDNPSPGIQVFVGYCGSQVYDNVFSGNGNNYAIQMTTILTADDSPSCRGYIYNNSIDCSLNSACIQTYYYNGGPQYSSGIAGQITIENNQQINPSGSGTYNNTMTSGTINQVTNTQMTSSLAASQGYTSAGKLAPTSSTGATVNAGTNASALCSTIPQLCVDASGAPWFGGSGKAQPPTGPWNTGAYLWQGGSGGPPSSSITAPSNGATVSGASVTLTATATPVSPATISSIQLYVDGSAFSSPCSSSPCTMTLDSTKISNSSHTIYAVAKDSNGQTGTAGTITVTVSNSIPGCFVSNPLAVNSQAITPETSTFTATWTEQPNSAANDTTFGLSASPASGNPAMSSILRANTSGAWDVYNGATGSYAATFTQSPTGGWNGLMATFIAANGATPVFVQSAGSSSGTASSSIPESFSVNTVAGNAIIVSASAVGPTVSSVTDTQGNTFVSAVSTGADAIYYATGIVGGADTVTVHFSGSSSFSIAYIHEYSGISATAAIDQTSSQAGTGTAVTSGSITTSQAVELIFGYASVNNSVSAPGTGFAARQTAGGNMSEDMVVAAAGSYQAANAAPYVSGTTYSFSGTMTFAGGRLTHYGISETSPSSIVIASGYVPRIPLTSIGYFNAVSDQGIYDTAKVCSFQIGGAATLSYSPGALNFGNVVNTMTGTKTETVSVTNGPATITSAVAAGTGFSIDSSSTCPNPSGSLGSTCTYVMDFTPPSTGSYSGTLTLTGNQSGSPQVINLMGSGIPAAATFSLSQNSLAFGNVLIHSTAAQGPILITVMNGPSTGSGVSFSGPNAADFGLAANTWTGSVSSGATVVSFTPSTLGAETATLTFTSGNATSTAPAVTLTGTGVTLIPIAPSPNLLMWNGPLAGSTKFVTCACVKVPFTCSCH